MSLFISALGPSLEAFLKFKNSIGIQYTASVRWYLKSLDQYNFKHGNSAVLCKSLVVGWSIEQSERSDSKRGSWISPVRACLKSSDEDGDERKGENLSRDQKYTLTILPKPSEFVEPGEKTLCHPTAGQNNKFV